MKRIICLAASLLALNFTPVSGQPNETVTPFQQRLIDQSKPQNQPPALTKFDLDFPGGTPKDLVAHIEKATGKPLNAIIPVEDADIQLPSLKMNDVNAPQLFAALEAASRKTVAVQNNPPGNMFNPGFNSSYSEMVTGYGFHTSDNPVTDTSIWYFHAEKPSLPPVVPPVVPPQNICQYYSLSPYLDRGFTVDDITTAIQTGWKMSGINPPPELNYHKETKLLIAFGEPDKLKTINQVLETLPRSNVSIATANEYEATIQSLQSKIVELNAKLKAVSAPATVGAPAEKTGK